MATCRAGVRAKVVFAPKASPSASAQNTGGHRGPPLPAYPPVAAWHARMKIRGHDGRSFCGVGRLYLSTRFPFAPQKLLSSSHRNAGWKKAAGENASEAALNLNSPRQIKLAHGPAQSTPKK